MGQMARLGRQQEESALGHWEQRRGVQVQATWQPEEASADLRTEALSLGPPPSPREAIRLQNVLFGVFRLAFWKMAFIFNFLGKT